MENYIYQNRNWTEFTWKKDELFYLLSEVSNLQGKLLGKIEMLGFELKDEVNLETLIQDVVQTSEIEGELLNPQFVRSSIAVRLGLEHGGVIHTDHYVEGIVEMLLDATQTTNKTLNDERLFSWHAALFPTGRSAGYSIEVAQYRSGEMQVVSGRLDKQIVHYKAPKAAVVPVEMKKFLHWFNTEKSVLPILKAAIAHLWFVTIHPFDDGNGRIARAIADMQLSKADGVNQRFYSMSAQINKERKSYYAILEETQKGDSDITGWLVWFLHCLKRAIFNSDIIVNKVVKKHQFWVKNASLVLNERQIKMLNKLLDGFEGKLKSSKWARTTKCSTDTALRDIKDLIEKGILRQEQQGGRSTNYELVEFQ